MSIFTLIIKFVLTETTADKKGTFEKYKSKINLITKLLFTKVSLVFTQGHKYRIKLTAQQ